uniref:Unannotated protein n=1 Tax=freshwater metagenome TaxID=449393 RepID=A0A6J7PAF4_9ZZZZ
MDALGPATALENAAGELVDDLHLAALHYVVLVALIQLLGLQRRLQLVYEVLLDLVVEIRDAERLLHLLDTGLHGEDNALVLLYFVVIVALQAPNDAGELVVELRSIGDTARDDQRRSRFIDEDGVHLVDDGIVVAPLGLVLQPDRHVVAEVVEPELVIGAVRDVASVCRTLLGRRLFVPGDDESDREAHEAVDATHPL